MAEVDKVRKRIDQSLAANRIASIATPIQVMSREGDYLQASSAQYSTKG